MAQTTTLLHRPIHAAFAAVASMIAAASCDGIVTLGSNSGGSSSSSAASTGGASSGMSCRDPRSMGGGYGAGGDTVGSCAACSQSSDCASPSSPCLVAVCAAGCCDTAAVPAGTPCGADGGAAVCDGHGACVPPCHTSSDCAAPAPCMITACVDGACVTSVEVGMECSAPVPQCCNGVCQDLATDPSNCGSCGHGCGYGLCQGSVCHEPVELACGSTISLCGFAIDATSIYWGDPVTDTILKVPLGGGSPTVIASAHLFNGCNMALDATSVYWTDGPGNPAGKVMKAPKGGGAPTVLASGQEYPTDIAVLGATVYWMNSPGGAGVDGALMKMPTTGTPTALATGLQYPRGLSVSPQGIYWTNWDSGTVMRLPLDGGTPVKIGSGAMPHAVAVDATSVYWSDIGSQQIMKAPLEGGPATLVVSESHAVWAISLDATSIYWAAGAIKKMPIGGGDVTVLASSSAEWLATDTKSIYWSTSDGIYKAPK